MLKPTGVLTALAMTVWGLPSAAAPLSIVAVDRQPVVQDGFADQFLVTVRFRNESELPDPGPWVLLPVPVGFVVVPGSVRGPGATASVSADGGGTFVRAGDWNAGRWDAVTHVRWELPGPLEPGVSGIVSFRLRAVQAENALDDE